MLHIHNGDCSADKAKQSSLAGEHFAFREALIEGPTPAGVEGNEWRVVRGRHLWSAYDVDLAECARELLAQEMKLASFEQHDEIVLWFEHDLFCQLHLIYLLDWFAKHDLGSTKLSLICIREFPGKENFRGLGELSPEQLASLFPTRSEVTPAQMTLATSAWRAYSSADPTEIEKLLQTDTSPLPFLASALRAHLERFPATSNGLGRVEKRVLAVLNAGPNKFSDLFAKFSEAEAIYGFGDAQLWVTLKRMSTEGQPLLTIAGLDREQIDRSRLAKIMQSASFEMTDLGRSVLEGKADAVPVNGINLWLGGAYLYDREGFWRWDSQTRTLVFDQNR